MLTSESQVAKLGLEGRWEAEGAAVDDKWILVGPSGHLGTSPAVADAEEKDALLVVAYHGLMYPPIRDVGGSVDP